MSTVSPRPDRPGERTDARAQLDAWIAYLAARAAHPRLRETEGWTR